MLWTKGSDFTLTSDANILISHLTLKNWYTLLSVISRSVFVTPLTAARQAPLSMRFSRQGYCSALPFPSPGDLPNPGIEPGLLYCRQIFTNWATREATDSSRVLLIIDGFSWLKQFIWLLTLKNTRLIQETRIPRYFKPHSPKLNYTNSWYLTIVLFNIFILGMCSICCV